jgi:hypothetical protein
MWTEPARKPGTGAGRIDKIIQMIQSEKESRG